MITITRKTAKAIEVVKRSGANMFDLVRIRQVMNAYQYPEAAEWVKQNPATYYKAIGLDYKLGDHDDTDIPE